VLSHGPGILLVVLFFEQEVGTRGEEGVRRFPVGDDGHDVAELRGEAAEHVDDLRRVAHRLAEIA
jgi:hypothetical protein